MSDNYFGTLDRRPRGRTPRWPPIADQPPPEFRVTADAQRALDHPDPMQRALARIELRFTMWGSACRMGKKGYAG